MKKRGVGDWYTYMLLPMTYIPKMTFNVQEMPFDTRLKKKKISLPWEGTPPPPPTGLRLLRRFDPLLCSLPLLKNPGYASDYHVHHADTSYRLILN